MINFLQEKEKLWIVLIANAFLYTVFTVRLQFPELLGTVDIHQHV